MSVMVNDADAFVVPFLPNTAATQTLARRLDRVGLDDGDHALTKAWLSDLALYEGLQAKEQRMALYMSAGRKIDPDTGEITQDEDQVNEAAFRAFVATLMPWQDHAAEGRQMVAYLDEALTALATMLEQDEVRWSRARLVWVGLRHGPLKRPLPPGALWGGWRWANSLRDMEHEGWKHAIRCRQLYRVLTSEGKRGAIEEFGLVEIGDLDPLWHGIWPSAERDALDQRADEIGVCQHWSLFNVQRKKTQHTELQRVTKQKRVSR